MKDGLKRVYYVCGVETVLVEDILTTLRQAVNPSPLEYVSLEGEDEGVWDALNQYPLDGTDRLVVVRGVETLSNWAPLFDWLESRRLPGTVAVFVSGEEAVDTKLPHIEAIRKRGRYVRCSPLKEDDAVALLSGDGSIERGAARKMLRLVGWDLAEAMNAMRKFSYFRGTADERVVAALVPPNPSRDFVNELMSLRKRNALEALRRLEASEYSMVIGGLDLRMDLAYRINRMLAKHEDPKTLVSNGRVSQYVYREVEQYALHYGKERVLGCLQALTFADGALREGASVGVMEAMVALW